MGAAYVNDFVEFGHIYQVKIEARDQAQRVIDDVLKLSVANSAGEMVPFLLSQSGRAVGTGSDQSLQYVFNSCLDL